MSNIQTLKDPNQIVCAEHNEDLNAKRVVIVGGEMPQFTMPEIKMPEIKMADFKFPEFVKVEVPVIVQQKEIQVVEIPVQIVTKEVQIVETQVVVVQKELQIEKIEVPTLVKEFEVIEKSVIVTEYKDIPKWIKALLIVQALVSIISLLKK